MRAAKAIVAAVGALVMALSAILADDVIDATEVGTLVTLLIEGVLTVLAVYSIPNKGFVETGQ